MGTVTAHAYHGTPITPAQVLHLLGARNYCISYYHRQQMAVLVSVASRLMIDNGAFSAWKKGIVLDRAYWEGFYNFLRQWLPLMPSYWWFVIPDVIDAGTQEQDALIRECPSDLLRFGAPVWHMDEPISRLLRLTETFPRVCIGSTAEYAVVGSTGWRLRMDDVFDAIDDNGGTVCELHMLRGLQCFLPSYDYPFDSGDSTDLARNHNRMKRHGERCHWAIKQKADRWDAMAALGKPEWIPRIKRQLEMFAA